MGCSTVLCVGVSMSLIIASETAISFLIVIKFSSKKVQKLVKLFFLGIRFKQMRTFYIEQAVHGSDRHPGVDSRNAEFCLILILADVLLLVTQLSHCMQ